jgi:hypothetical protein
LARAAPHARLCLNRPAGIIDKPIRSRMRSSPRSVPPVDQCPTEIFRSRRALSRRRAALSRTAAIAGARKAPGSAPFSRSRLVTRKYSNINRSGWLREPDSNPHYGGRTLLCFCATALLPLCRSEAQLNRDEKGSILAAASTPLGRPGIRPPRRTRVFIAHCGSRSMSRSDACGEAP